MELESFFDNNIIGVLYIKPPRHIYRVNRRMAEILGYEDPHETVGMNVKDIHIDEEHFMNFGNEYRQLLLNREVFQRVYPLRHRDGSTRWMTISGKVLDHQGTPYLEKGVLWMFEDITERRTAE